MIINEHIRICIAKDIKRDEIGYLCQPLIKKRPLRFSFSRYKKTNPKLVRKREKNITCICFVSKSFCLTVTSCVSLQTLIAM